VKNLYASINQYYLLALPKLNGLLIYSKLGDVKSLLVIIRLHNDSFIE